MAERYVGEFTVTAYCSCQKCCGRSARGLTASGKHVSRGMIAADWGVTDPILSERDQQNPRRADLPANRRPYWPMRT